MKLSVVSLAVSAALLAQAPRPIGTISGLDLAAKRLILKTDSGPELAVVLDERTSFVRVAPGEKDLSHAAKIDPSALAPGDRILVRGKISEDQKSIAATQVIAMSRAELARKHAADRAEWEKRGLAGTITALDPSRSEITVTSRGRPVLISVTANTVIRRYAPDSIQFSDARPSSFAELRLGDQVRARGNRSEDATRLAAEEIVSGAFHNIAATISAVDTTAGTLKITDLDTKRPLLVRIKPESSLRRMPERMAQFLAMRLSAGAQQANPGGAGRAPDFQQMLEKMPGITLAELKPGDALVIASTAGASPGEITAITVLAGVEPVLASPPSSRQSVLGAWNLDLNMTLPQ